ncbi:Hypothetical predicted protein [Mytilus galloprovincialis]|uniref:Protein SSUH2 homolog n=1 Tax=Mytilus galloprovincialis TaxID=29158 RepID=A0A8B6BW57_MYTGA|nr:Hypothetical predicted protein [Mytilus galloprovincialis]
MSIVLPLHSTPPPKIEVPKYAGDMPDEDVDHNPDAAPPEPTAPTLDGLSPIPGYQNIGFSGDFLPPPPFEDVVQPPEERKDITNLSVISEDEARQALRLYVGENCCFGKKPVEELTFTELQSSNAFHYELDTYTEARSTEWTFVPYTGGPLDGPENGPAPGPWDIPAQCKKLFKDEKRESEVPHTATTKPCHNCFAVGFIRCWHCQGRGQNRCTSCSGSGKRMDDEEACPFCNGTGKRDCLTCHSKGNVICKICQGHRILKYFIQLTIKWHKHDDNHIVERTSLPDKLVKKVEGQTAFEETYPRVYPIQHFAEQEINNASASLISKHQYSMERILMQRHRVRIVPVTVCRYKWEDTDSDFIVYGLDKKVHAPDYPQQSCFGCSVL